MRHRHYAEDPNFTGLSWKDQTTGPPLTADFTPIAADADFKALPQATGPGGGLGGDGSSEYGIEYVLENSMEAAEQWRDITTAIVYRLKYSPDESSLKRDPATNTVAIGVDKSYFVFGSFVIAPKDLDDIYDGVFTIDPRKYPDLAALLT